MRGRESPSHGSRGGSYAAGALGFDPRPHIVERARGAELLVFVGDEFGVLLNEGFTGRAKIEFARVVAKILTVHARPDEAPVGIDIHFRHTEPGRGQVLFFVYAARARVEGSAG